MWAAEPVQNPSPALFFVESIRVDQGERAQHDVIITESRLKVGKSYSEAELQNGRNRIVQLPFIKGAELSLERGTEPGKFVLVIEVVETKKWFFGFDLESEFSSNRLVSSSSGPTSGLVSGAPLVGRHFFLGRAGVLTSAFGGKNVDHLIRYTQYDLLGRGIGLSVGYGVSLCLQDATDVTTSCSSRILSLAADPTFATWSQSGTLQQVDGSLNMPLAPSLSFLTEVSLRHTQDGYKREILFGRSDTAFAFRKLHEVGVRLSTVYDTLDDPVGPRSGERWTLGMSRQRIRGDFSVEPIPESPDIPVGEFLEGEVIETGATASWLRYWPRRSFSLFAVGDLFAGRVEWQDLPLERDARLTGDAIALRATVGVGLATDLWQSKRPGSLADLRFETDISLLWNGTIPSSDLSDSELSAAGEAALQANPLRAVRLRTGLVYRSRRTVVRLSVAYNELLQP